MFNGKKAVSAFVATIVVMLVVLIPLSFFGYQIFQEAKNLYVGINNGDMQLSGAVLERYMPRIAPSLTSDLGQYAAQGLQWVVAHLSVIFSSAIAVLANFALILFTLFFLFRDEETFRNMILAASPLGDEHSRELLEKIELAIASVTKGTLMVALLQGILAGIGFAMVHISNPIVWATVAMFASMIPAGGTGLVVIPAIVYLFLTGHGLSAVILTIWGIGVVGTVDNIVRPALIGKGIKIHPLLILFSALGGLQFLGIIGFFVGPVALAVLFALYEMYPRIMHEQTGQGIGQ